MGYDPASDNGAEQWRDVYWSLGQNLVDMINKSEAEQRWDLAGVGYFMKAWGWLVLTDMHGEIIVKEAIDPTRCIFDYDTQDYVYSEVQRLLGLAINDLQRTDGAVDADLSRKDGPSYNGDRTKWLKMAYGLQAIMPQSLLEQGTYKPGDVIAAVDQVVRERRRRRAARLSRRPTPASPTTTSGAARATTSRATGRRSSW